MQLYTPALQARARAFYERQGWSTDGVMTFEPMMGLDLVRYTRGLSIGPDPAGPVRGL
jgi:hypothetical protein